MQSLFRCLEPLGLHVTRNHFYEPIPDTRSLDPGLWSGPHETPGVDLRPSEQIELLRQAVWPYASECAFPHENPRTPNQYFYANDFFQAFDAEIYHCFVRHFKPKRIVEIGSGYSTLIAANAAVLNEKSDGHRTELFSIEPYPNQTLLDGFPGLTRLLKEDVQKVDPSLFQSMQANDILFIDSSHAVKIGGDVVYEYLRILPILNPGVLVHIHDIFIPEEYPREWVLNEHKFWSEQYLLQAFLAFNQHFKVLWSSNYMGLLEKSGLEELFPAWKGSYARLSKSAKAGALTRDGQNVRPSSFWIQRTTGVGDGTGNE